MPRGRPPKADADPAGTDPGESGLVYQQINPATRGNPERGG